jgi:GH24 family phage-related lysozyme (muramidase)
MQGPNRSEMRDIRDAVPNQDYPRIASSIRHMERLWRGTVNERGLTRRREAEAALVLTP